MFGDKGVSETKVMTNNISVLYSHKSHATGIFFSEEEKAVVLSELRNPPYTAYAEKPTKQFANFPARTYCVLHPGRLQGFQDNTKTLVRPKFRAMLLRTKACACMP